MRRNIVAVIAVFAALAVGLALGAGPLNHDSSTAEPPASPTQQAEDPGLKAQAAQGETFATDVGPALLDGRLAGQRVALVVLPGASDSVVSALGKQIGAAGGAVQTTMTLSDGALQSGSRTLVDTLGVQLGKQLHSGINKKDTTYVRFGELLGMSVGTPGTRGGELSTDQQTARASLLTAKLASASGAKTSAPLVLLVLGDTVDDAILSGVVQGIGTTVHGLVVAGSTTAGASGDLKDLRGTLSTSDGPRVATVDGDDTAIGQIVTVLALVRQITGGGGSFGASGVDGFQPLA